MQSLIGALVFLIWIADFINIFCVTAQFEKKSEKLAVLNDGVFRFFTFALIIFSFALTIFVSSIMLNTHSKGGFFVNQQMDYTVLRNLFATSAAAWFVLLNVQLCLNAKLFFVSGNYFLINGLLMLLALLWLWNEKRTYKNEMSKIWWENKEAGQVLSREQTQTIYEQQKRVRIIENPHLYDGYDREGRPRAHLVEAINSDQYYQMKKWMNELETTGCKDRTLLNAQKITAQKIHREMGERCKLILLDPSKRRKLDKLAQLNVIMSDNRYSRPQYNLRDPYHYSFTRPSCSYSYNDLRRNSDIPPPSYKTTESTICSSSLCDIDL